MMKYSFVASIAIFLFLLVTFTLADEESKLTRKIRPIERTSQLNSRKYTTTQEVKGRNPVETRRPVGLNICPPTGRKPPGCIEGQFVKCLLLYLPTFSFR